MNNDLYNSLIFNLDRFIRKYYKNELIKGLFYSVGGLVTAFLIAATLEYFGQFNTAVRSVLFYAYIVFAVGVLYKFILIPILKLYKIGETISQEQAANIIGKHFENVKDKLLNVLQLKQQSVDLPNDLLLQAGINQKIQQLSPVPFSRAVNFKENNKYFKYIAPILLIGLLLLIFIPKIYTDAPKRIIEYNQYFAPVMPFKLSIENKELKALKNEDFTLKLAVSGAEIPKEVYIEFDNKRFLMDKLGKLDFQFTFKNLQSNITFHFSANGFNSESHILKVLPKPILLDFTVQLNYPKYTHKKDQTLTNNGNLIVPQGTKISWIFNTIDAQKLLLQINDSSSFVPEKTKNQYGFKIRAMRSFKYALKPVNSKVQNLEFVKYAMNVIPDQYPEIQLQSRADSVTHKLVYFNGFIKDDYGLTKLTFNFRRSADSTHAKNKWKVIPILVNKELLQQNFFYTWNLDTLNLQPGENINYFFQVWDNDAVNGPKSTKTAIRQFGVPKYEVLAEKSNKQAQTIENTIEQTISQAIRLKSGLNQLNEDLFNKTQMGWQEKQKINDLIDLHNSMQKNIEKILQNNEKKNAIDKNYMKLDSNLIKKQEELQKLMKQLQSPELKKLFKQLQDMMKKLNKEQLQTQIDKIKLSNKDINKEMDRTLELFKQLEFQKQLNQLKNKLEKMQAKQDSLAEASAKKKADLKQIKKSQDKLNDMFKQAKDDIKALQKQNEQLENKHNLGEMQKLSNEVSQEQQNASNQLQNQKGKKASGSQQNAANNMQKMSQMAGNMLMKMSSGASQQDLQGLRTLLENVVRLSFNQEKIMDELKNTAESDPQYIQLNRKEKYLSESSKMVEDSLFALSKKVFQIKSTVNKEIDKINMNLSKAMSYMADHKTMMALTRQQYVMTSYNNLALLLDDAVQQMESSMKSKMPGSGSCNKPGGSGKPSSSPSMKSLEQMMKEQLESMQKAMKEGGEKRGNMPGSLPGQSMSEKLAKMAAEQAYIRQQMQQMMNQMNGSGGEKGMNGINKMLEQNKKDIVNNNITAETIKRQRKILTRLLQAENAEKTRGYSKKRIAIQAKKQKFSNQNNFLEYNKEKQAEVEMLQTLPPNFTNYYKKKVANYFQNVIEK